MKTIINHEIRNYFIIVALLFITSGANSQNPPVYGFKNPTLLSGTSGQVNATYRFPSVAQGVDAIVKITAKSAGITLLNIDRTLDGYKEAFQPEYEVAPMANGYIDFMIVFVNPGNGNPKPQAVVDASGLDIDGTLFAGIALKEYNSINLGGGICTFNLLNSEIAVSTNSTAFVANNITGNLFGTLVDTAASQVMYSVRNVAVDTFYFRAGAINGFPLAIPRYASLYFKRFTYPNTGVLSVNNLEEFKGVAQDNKVAMQWTLTEGNNARNIVLEKSDNGAAFNAAAEFQASENNSRHFYYTDNKITGSSAFYRLKIVAADGKTQYSNVLHFKLDSDLETEFTVFPTMVQSTATVRINAKQKRNGMLTVTDISGKVVKQTPVIIQAGSNSLVVDGFDQFQRGNYFVTVNTNNQRLSKQVVVQ